jgi:hypothetical protein
MRLTDTARTRARSLCAVAAGVSALVAALAYFGFDDGSWQLVLPIAASLFATIWPTRIVVATAMIATAAVVVMGMDDSGVLFGATVAILMLALNSLQEAATRVRKSLRRKPEPA